MQKNSQNFSMQEALRLAHSDAGQRLLAMLSAAGGDSLKKAAAQGDVEAVKKSLGPLLQDPAFQALLKQLEGNHG